jgi:putative SOS response-associated peptidase YedK
VVGKIHTRMPVILYKEDEAAWLNPDIVEPERLYHLLSPFEDSAMEDYRVSHEVNTLRNDHGELIKPVDSK